MDYLESLRLRWAEKIEQLSREERGEQAKLSNKLAGNGLSHSGALANIKINYAEKS